MSSRVCPRWPRIHQVTPLRSEFTVQARMSRPELPGLPKWVTSWEECGSQEGSNVPGSWHLDWGMVRSKMILGGVSQGKVEAGTVIGMRGWIQPPAGGCSNPHYFSQFTCRCFLRLKALTMALDRLTCFYFFLPERRLPWVPASTIILSYFQNVSYGYSDVSFIFISLLSLPPAPECYPPGRGTGTSSPLCPWCKCLTYRLFMMVDTWPNALYSCLFWTRAASVQCEVVLLSLDRRWLTKWTWELQTTCFSVFIS